MPALPAESPIPAQTGRRVKQDHYEKAGARWFFLTEALKVESWGSPYNSDRLWTANYDSTEATAELFDAALAEAEHDLRQFDPNSTGIPWIVRHEMLDNIRNSSEPR